MKSTNFACDICEKTWKIVRIVYREVADITVSMGYARAASVLAQQGLHDEAKYLMLGAKYHRENAKEEQMLNMFKRFITRAVEAKQKSVNREIERFYLDKRHRYIK